MTKGGKHHGEKSAEPEAKSSNAKALQFHSKDSKDSKKGTAAAAAESAKKPVRVKKQKPVDTETWRKLIESRRKIIHEHVIMDGMVTVREFDNMDCDGAFILEGFPAEGVTAILTAQFFVDALNLPLIGDMVSTEFPPTCTVKQFRPSQACRIYGNKQLVVFASEFALTPEVAHAIVHAVFDFARRHRCKAILTTDGYPEQDKTANVTGDDDTMAVMDGDDSGKSSEGQATDSGDDSESEDEDDDVISNFKIGVRGGGGGDEDGDEDAMGPDGDEEASAVLQKLGESLDRAVEPKDVRFITNSIQLGDKCLALGFLPLKSGIIKGVSGGLTADMYLRDIDVLCLLAPFNPMLTDTKGALVLSKALLNLSGLQDIDTSKLEKRVGKVEKKIRSVIDKIAGISGSNTDAPSGMYL
eukprot:ANDGO_03402.mRNA.1 hypothetical protein